MQEVKIVTNSRNKYTTAMRAAITGRNAAADLGDMDLYRSFDQAFDQARLFWEYAQQEMLENDQ